MSRLPDDLPATPVRVRHFDGLGADLNDQVLAIDDIAVSSVHRRGLAVRQYRPLDAIGALQDIEKIVDGAAGTTVVARGARGAVARREQ